MKTLKRFGEAIVIAVLVTIFLLSLAHFMVWAMISWSGWTWAITLFVVLVFVIYEELGRS